MYVELPKTFRKALREARKTLIKPVNRVLVTIAAESVSATCWDDSGRITVTTVVEPHKARNGAYVVKYEAFNQLLARARPPLLGARYMSDGTELVFCYGLSQLCLPTLPR